MLRHLYSCRPLLLAIFLMTVLTACVPHIASIAATPFCELYEETAFRAEVLTAGGEKWRVRFEGVGLWLEFDDNSRILPRGEAISPQGRTIYVRGILIEDSPERMTVLVDELRYLDPK